MSPDMGAALCPKDAPGLQRQAWGSADARDQLRRASSSTVLNVAEACGKTGADRRRFFLIARGSACEAAAALDVLAAFGAVDAKTQRQCHGLCDRLYAMLTRLSAAGR